MARLIIGDGIQLGLEVPELGENEPNIGEIGAEVIGEHSKLFQKLAALEARDNALKDAISIINKDLEVSKLLTNERFSIIVEELVKIDEAKEVNYDLSEIKEIIDRNVSYVEQAISTEKHKIEQKLSRQVKINIGLTILIIVSLILQFM